MVEFGCIDYGYYVGSVYNVFIDVIELLNVVKVVVELVDLSNIIIIVIVDYSYVFIIVGYFKCGNLILGKVVSVGLDEFELVVDGMLYMIVGYMNGYGMCDLGNEIDVDEIYGYDINVGCMDFFSIDIEVSGYYQEVLIFLGFEIYVGEDVVIYGVGFGVYLVSGINE